MKKMVAEITLVLALFILVSTYFLKSGSKQLASTVQKAPNHISQRFKSVNPQALNDPLRIETMRKQQYPGSAIQVEQLLPDGSNYHQYIVSYQSDGLKIYGLLSIPISQMPKGGYPVIIFNHGYISPNTYQTAPSVGQYATYFPVFASNGYVVFKPDYRGNGNSQGKPQGAYYSPAYTTDDLNAIASIKKLTDPTTKNSHIIVNQNKIGVWGHSMGGNITLRDLVVEPSWIKVAVIWGGVVGSYSDLLTWHDPHFTPPEYEQAIRNQSRSKLLQIYGTPKSNPNFWNAIDPTFFVSDIQASMQLHAGSADDEVPPRFSQELFNSFKKDGKTAEFYEYPGADHNISQGFDLAMQRSLAFFDKYLK